jgi:hypothetical protein
MWELIRLSLRTVSGHRLRSVLSMVGIAIGIASVILLTRMYHCGRCDVSSLSRAV